MSKVNLPPIPGGYLSLGAMNSRFAAIEAAFDNTLSRDGSLPNSMEADLDLNGNLILNVGFDPNNPSSLVSVAQLDSVEAASQAGDAHLQAQLSGGVPLTASAFSEISWHEQAIGNSVTIPEDKNAWSFGPVMSIPSGNSVTISDGSFWTIANGQVIS